MAFMGLVRGWTAVLALPAAALVAMAVVGLAVARRRLAALLLT